MVLSFPRDLVLEAYLGRWVDVTALPVLRSLRQDDPVTVNWGLPDEQATVALAPPSTVDAALNNQGGHWTPDNPMSDYYAYLRARNVPTRLSLRASRDTFTGRTSAFSWLVSDTNDGWNEANGGAFGGVPSVGSGVGVHTMPNADSYIVSYLGDSYPDCQTAISSTTLVNDVAGGAVEPCNLVQRFQPGTGEHYLLRVSVSAAEVLTVAIHHSTNGALSPTVNLFTYTPGSSKGIRAKFQVEGQMLRGKVYSPGPANDPDQFEPLDWQVTARDASLSGGFPGVRTGIAAGNSNVPVTVQYDDWDLKLLRHTGELARVQPDWDVTHKFKTASIKLADITQRLGKPQRAALSSAPRRYLASNADFTATDHWPMDESATATAQGLNAVSGGSLAFYQRNTSTTPNRGAVTWGETDQVMLAVPGFVTLNNGSRFIFTPNAGPLGSGFSFMMAVRLSPDAETQILLDDPGGGANHYAVVLRQHTTGIYEIFGNNGAVNLGNGDLPYPAGIDSRWITVGFSARNQGANNIGYCLVLDGAVVVTGSWFTGGTYTALSKAQVFVAAPNTGGQGSTALSNVFITATQLDAATAGGPLVGTVATNMLKGWPGEKAITRAARICAEEGVPFDYWDDPNQSRAMGPQRPVPLLDQVVACAEADQGFVYGPRYTAGLAIRSRRSMCARPADVTLSYSGGMVAPDLEQSADDRPTVNVARAERQDGGFVILEQASGPMNTKNPGTDPDAVGKTPGGVTVNVESDAQIGDVAGWLRALGTVPEVRFPHVSVNLRAPALTDVPGLAATRALVTAHVGDRLAVTGLTAADIYRDLDQLVRGGMEVFGSVYEHRITLNTAPYEKYRSGVYGGSTSRWDQVGTTTLDAQLTVGTTGAVNITSSAGTRWTTDAGAYPLSVVVGGELVTLSGMSGAGSNQTMTISARAVNGAAKTHPAGTAVALYLPVYYC